jgi:hypothetical protein
MILHIRNAIILGSYADKNKQLQKFYFLSAAKAIDQKVITLRSAIYSTNCRLRR